MPLYTLVKHSATTTGHAEFARGVELRSITAKQAEKIRNAGGLVFPDYTSAAEAEEAENYPPEVTGLVPHVRGSFASMVVQGSPLYVPRKD